MPRTFPALEYPFEAELPETVRRIDLSKQSWNVRVNVSFLSRSYRSILTAISSTRWRHGISVHTWLFSTCRVHCSCSRYTLTFNTSYEGLSLPDFGLVNAEARRVLTDGVYAHFELFEVAFQRHEDAIEFFLAP